MQSSLLHAADERDFKNAFLHSNNNDKDALQHLSERPNFYTDVYFMIKPKICYSKYARKFFDLVDIILSSSHVPVYIVAAFVKRLSRVLLYAPLFCQLPIISIIKNILQRHRLVYERLVNRAEPSSMDNDPYDENERDLMKCNVNDSSLWELRSIQQHWHHKVAEKANFIDRNVQSEEVHIQWKSVDEIFDSIFEFCSTKLQRQNVEDNCKEEINDENEKKNVKILLNNAKFDNSEKLTKEEKVVSFLGLDKNTLNWSL